MGNRYSKYVNTEELKNAREKKGKSADSAPCG